jgi:hypothetical protein
MWRSSRRVGISAWTTRWETKSAVNTGDQGAEHRHEQRARDAARGGALGVRAEGDDHSERGEGDVDPFLQVLCTFLRLGRISLRLLSHLLDSSGLS